LSKIDLSKVSKLINWSSLKLTLHTNSNNAKHRKVFRGQVYECYLGENVGSEESKLRPCIILQNDSGNLNSPNTIVAPITNTKGIEKVTVDLEDKYDSDGNIILTGHVLLGNIVTISKARIKGDCIIKLTKEMKEIDEKLMTSVGLIGKYKKLETSLEKDKQFIKKLNKEKYERENLFKNIMSELGVTNKSDILGKIKELKENKED